MTATRPILLLALLALLAPPAAAQELDEGCWEGRIGDGRQVARVIVRTVDGDLRLRLLAAEPKDYRLEAMGDSLGGWALRPLDPGEEEVQRRLRLEAAADGSLGGEYRRDGQSRPARLSPAPGGALPEGILGRWDGLLEALRLRLVLHLEEGPCGLLLGTADSPDQGGSGMPLTHAWARGDSLGFALQYVGASFAGERSPDGGTISGVFEQNGLRLPLELGREARGAPRRAQDPQPPFPYTTHQVQVDAGAVSLAGTLVLPGGDRPLPTVLFVSGSGAQDRDEQLAGHRPFLVLADHLARQGIASLRCDDRGVGGSTGDSFQATLEDIAGDIRAQAAWLRARPEVGPVVLVGHSEGGWSGPLAAAGNGDIDGLVLLAGPGVGGRELLEQQHAALFRASGVGEEMVRLHRRYAAASFRRLAGDLDDEDALREAILSDYRAMDQLLAAGQREQLDALWGLDPEGDREAQLTASLQPQLTPWFRFLLRHQPGGLARVEQPVLALLGGKDLQVPADANAAALRGLLAGHPDATVEILPGLNHLFQEATTGLPQEYAQIEQTMAPVVMERVAGWILTRWGGR